MSDMGPTQSMDRGNSPIKVLFLIPSFAVGGAEIQLSYLVEHLDSRAITPYVFAVRSGPLLPRFMPLEGRLLVPPMDGQGRFARFLSLVKKTRAESMDVVHSFLWGYHFWDLTLAKLVGANFVTSRRDMTKWLKRCDWRSWIYRHAACRVVANSHVGARVMEEKEGYPQQKIRVVHNAVPIPTTKLAWPEDLPMPLPEELTITYLSAVKEGKRHSFLVDVAERLPPDGPKWRLYLAGRDCADGALEKRIAASPVRSRIHYLGERRDAQAILSHTDLFVMPAVGEGFSNALSEAMAMGVACVAARSGALPELIGFPDVGKLCPPDDSDAFVDAIVHLLSDRVGRVTMGRKARHHVAEYFSCEMAAKGFQKVYEEL